MASRKRRGKKSRPRKKRVYQIPAAKLKRAQKIRRYGLGLSIIVFLWIIFKPVPYFVVIPIALIVPVLSFVILFKHGRIFDSENDDEDDYDNDDEGSLPKEWYPIVLPTIGLGLRFHYDYDLAGYGLSLLIAGLVSAVAVAFYAYKLKKRSENTLESILLALVALPIFFAYFWSALIFVNCYLDRSDPQVFPAEVLSKRIVEGDSSDSFFISIDAGGPNEPPLKVRISEDLFDEVDERDEVTVTLRQGTLGFPWYYIAY